MSQDSGTFIVTFKDVSSYEKYKQEVINNGGTIKNDLGTTLLGFTAVMPPTLVELMSSDSLTDNGIIHIEADSKVTIQ